MSPRPVSVPGPSAHRFSAVEYLTPTDYQNVDGLTLPTAWNFNATPSVSTGFGTGRVTPDAVADADPFTGYLLYFSKFASGGHRRLAGAAPLRGTAVQRCHGTDGLVLGHRVGFWNTAAYEFAAGANSPFTPLDVTRTSNDNLYYTGTQAKLFNVGTGLGTPNFARLAEDFRQQQLTGHPGSRSAGPGTSPRGWSGPRVMAPRSGGASRGPAGAGCEAPSGESPMLSVRGLPSPGGCASGESLPWSRPSR